MSQIEKILLAIAIGIGALMFMIYFGSPIVAKFPPIKQAVIEDLKRDYCPSPYGPGFDPDKIDVTEFTGKKLP